tara:strand:- start:1676 stop:2521 length:846 start_codon:yes stop_codon:yes gene_type:complete
METKDIFKKYAKGDIDAPLKVISLGMGVQSTALYLMSSMGYKVPRADVAIFADPQAEHYKTYDMLKWLLDWQKKNDGIKIIVNKDKNILKDILKSQNSRGAKWTTIPAYSETGGMVMRQCTGEYKIQTVQQTIRNLHKLKTKKRMKRTEMWLGISTDEIERMKESRMYNIKYFYPLIYHNISRNDCVSFFKDNNFPVPVKSSCTFCPYHSNSYWKEVQRENGKAWEDAIKVDRQIRNSSKKGEKEKLYLHFSCKPLEEIDFEDNQLEMFEGFNCDEGYCGL